MSTVFITGTDTGVGKTFVSCALLRALCVLGVKAGGYKPVATGCERTSEGLRNADALALRAAAGMTEPYAQINPYAFEAAIAPHIAAQQAGVEVNLQELDAAHAALAERYRLMLVEGAGGWQVPLNPYETFAGWVQARQWPVLLVVGMRLGCINHALLSAESITGCAPWLGWVANVLPPEMPELQGNIETLRQRMPADFLGIVRSEADAAALAAQVLQRLPKIQ